MLAKTEASIETKVAAIDDKVARRIDAALAPPEESSGTLAAQAANLESTLAIVEKVAGGSGPGVLSAEEHAALATKPNEAAVVEFMTPYLQALCLPHVDEMPPLCPPVLVNSETHKWLVQPGEAAAANRQLHLKPDSFLSWWPFIKEEPPSEGVLASVKLQKAGCVSGLLEAKVEPLTLTWRGKLYLYHRCLMESACCRSILFNKDEFYLYRTEFSRPVALIRSEWTSPGSAAEIRAFFAGERPPALVLHMRALLESLAAKPIRHEGRCHLGSGSYAHVFRVTTGDSDASRALKVSVFKVDSSGGTSAAMALFDNEFAGMVAAAAAGAPVVRPVATSLRLLRLGADVTVASGGGYLMDEVGSPFSAVLLRDFRDVFQALAALHTRRVIHGDARPANAVRCANNELKWVDLAGGPVPSGVSDAEFELRARMDVLKLATSIIGLAIPAAVDAAIRGYHPADGASVAAVVAAVWAARPNSTSSAAGAAAVA